jgi:hypothetical protein
MEELSPMIHLLVSNYLMEIKTIFEKWYDIYINEIKRVIEYNKDIILYNINEDYINCIYVYISKEFTKYKNQVNSLCIDEYKKYNNISNVADSLQIYQKTYYEIIKNKLCNIFIFKISKFKEIMEYNNISSIDNNQSEKDIHNIFDLVY